MKGPLGKKKLETKYFCEHKMWQNSAPSRYIFSCACKQDIISQLHFSDMYYVLTSLSNTKK